jgi:hypothetical protein
VSLLSLKEKSTECPTSESERPLFSLRGKKGQVRRGKKAGSDFPVEYEKRRMPSMPSGKTPFPKGDAKEAEIWHLVENSLNFFHRVGTPFLSKQFD